MKNGIFVIFFAATALAVMPAYAQSVPIPTISPETVMSSNAVQWQETVDEVRADTQLLLKQNEELTKEYKILQAKLAEMNTAVAGAKAKLDTQQQAAARLKKIRAGQQKEAQESEARLKEIRREIAALEDGNGQLKKNLAGTRAQNSDWEKKLGDLQERERALVMSIKMKEFSTQQQTDDTSKEIQRLKNKLALSQKKEDVLQKTIAGLRKQVTDFPQKMGGVKKSIGGLQQQLDKVRVGLAAQQQKNRQLEKQNAALAAHPQGVPQDLRKEQAALQKEVAGLEKQLKGIQAQVEQSNDVLRKKREMMNKVMSLDGENQSLREKIAQLLTQVNDLKAKEDKPAAAGASR